MSPQGNATNDNTTFSTNTTIGNTSAAGSGSYKHARQKRKTPLIIPYIGG
jgi:hypothetical protein